MAQIDVTRTYLIDDQDAERCGLFTWYMDSHGYATARLPGGSRIRLGQFIAGGICVKHINGDKRDCRRANLTWSGDNHHLAESKTAWLVSVRMSNDNRPHKPSFSKAALGYEGALRAARACRDEYLRIWVSGEPWTVEDLKAIAWKYRRTA